MKPPTIGMIFRSKISDHKYEILECAWVGDPETGYWDLRILNITDKGRPFSYAIWKSVWKEPDYEIVNPDPKPRMRVKPPTYDDWFVIEEVKKRSSGDWEITYNDGVFAVTLSEAMWNATEIEDSPLVQIKQNTKIEQFVVSHDLERKEPEFVVIDRFNAKELVRGSEELCSEAVRKHNYYYGKGRAVKVPA